MPSQFSKDQRVFLVLEYTKRRRRKGFKMKLYTSLIIGVPSWNFRKQKKNNFSKKCSKNFISSKKIEFADFFNVQKNSFEIFLSHFLFLCPKSEQNKIFEKFVQNIDNPVFF